MTIGTMAQSNPVPINPSTRDATSLPVNPIAPSESACLPVSHQQAPSPVLEDKSQLGPDSTEGESQPTPNPVTEDCGQLPSGPDAEDEGQLA